MSERSLILNSIYPYFDFLIASSSSSGLTKVPLLTLGMNPFGPNTLAKGFNYCICSVVAISLSNSKTPAAIYLITSLLPITSTPASTN